MGNDANSAVRTIRPNRHVLVALVGAGAIGAGVNAAEATAR